jgi:hypothetical protein
VIDTTKVELPPALTFSADGDDAILKSGGGLTVKSSWAECALAADVPLTIRVKVPGATVAGTDRLTVWLLPALNVNGEAGDVIAPAGNPESVTVTGSEKPFWPVIDTAKVELELPGSTVRVDGDDVMLKSFVGGGELGRPAQPTKLNSQIAIRTGMGSLAGDSVRRLSANRIKTFRRQQGMVKPYILPRDADAWT